MMILDGIYTLTSVSRLKVDSDQDRLERYIPFLFTLRKQESIPVGCCPVGEGRAVHIRKYHHNTPSPVDKMKHTSENITLPQTSFACGNKHSHLENKYLHVQLSF